MHNTINKSNSLYNAENTLNNNLNNVISRIDNNQPINENIPITPSNRLVVSNLPNSIQKNTITNLKTQIKNEQNNTLLNQFKEIRPYIVKIFTHAVIFYLAVYGWIEYLNSNENYSGFIKRLNLPIVTDAILINATENCLDYNMTDIQHSYFPKIEKGCQCDNKILPKLHCDYIYNKYLIPSNSSKQTNLSKNTTWDKNCLRYFPLNINKPSFNYKRQLQEDDFAQEDFAQEDFAQEDFAQEDFTQEDFTQEDFTQEENPGEVDDFTQNDDQLINELEDLDFSNIEDVIDNTQQFEDKESLIDDNNDQIITYTNEFLEKNNIDEDEGYDNLNKDTELYKNNNDKDLIDPTELDNEFFDDPNDEQFYFPEQNNNINSFKKNKIQVTNINGRLTPINDKGQPLDLIKNEEYPKKCHCFRDINNIPSAILKNWINYSKICIKKDPFMSTLSYLKSINKFRDCKKANRCQKYFCKEDNQKCPLIDVWISKEDPDIFSKYYKDFKLFHSTKNTHHRVYGQEYLLQVLLPIIDIKIAMKNSCSNYIEKEQEDYKNNEETKETDINSFKINNEVDSSKITSNPGFSYNLIEQLPCSLSQTSGNLAYASAKDILNSNGKLYDHLANHVPFIKESLEKNLSFNLESVHTFYRNTITCLMKKNDLKSMFEGKISMELDNTANDSLKKLENILFSFFSVQDYFNFQAVLQKFVLIINAIILLVHVSAVLIKFLSFIYFKNSRSVWLILKWEVYLSFFIDLISASVGAYAYFTITQILDIINNMLSHNCQDDYSKSKYGIYTDALQSTADLNFEVLVVIMFKITLIIFTAVYYCFALKGSMNSRTYQKIFFESISEGDDYEDDFEEIAIIENIKDHNNNKSIRNDNGHI